MTFILSICSITWTGEKFPVLRVSIILFVVISSRWEIFGFSIVYAEQKFLV